MGRTFHTLEDNYPELDETFIVEFLNAVSKGHDGRCAITITDDDGVGIRAIWYADGTGKYVSYEAPVDTWFDDLQPGAHYFAVGTPYQSVNNTGPYTVSLIGVAE